MLTPRSGGQSRGLHRSGLRRSRPARTWDRARQRGLSLVELMVGVAVGLMVVAGAATMTAMQLADTRRLTLESQIQQDLRASTTMMQRELRQAGYWRGALQGVALDSSPPAPASINPYRSISVSPWVAPGNQVVFFYSRGSVENNVIDDDEWRGFRLRNGVLQAQFGRDNWQPLTDPNLMTVTELRFTLSEQQVVLSCDRTCVASSSGACPPVVTVRHVRVQVAAQAARDPAVRTQMDTSIRPRNDQIEGRCQ